jgi:ATP-binding cassette, subfamily B, multidrug efflux pump
MQSLKRALVYLNAYRLMSLGAVFSLLMFITANALTPQLFRWGIDEGIAKKDLNVVFLVGGLLVAIAFGRGLFSFGQSFWSEAVAQGVAYELRNQLFSKVQNLSFSYHDRAPTSQLLTRVTSDIEQIRTFVGATLLQLLSSIVTLLSVSAILLVMNWQLALIALMVIPFAMGLMFWFFSNTGTLFRITRQVLGELNGVLKENLLGVRTIKAYVREEREVKRYTEKNQELLAANLKTVKAISGTFPNLFLLSNLVVLVVVGYGGNAVMKRQFSIGELVAFNSYLAFILQPILQIGFAAPIIAQAAASAARMYEVIDTEVEIKNLPNAIPWNNCRGRITFENVSFRYPGTENYALKNISLEAKPNELVAVLGTTGAGKTTLVNLIPRFYDVTTGEIRIDGTNVKNFTLESMRSHIGIVFQESRLFSGTIRDNIAYAVPDASMEDVIRVAKLARIHDFITGLPQGYETLVGERGVGLSGGQKQRVAIARTLLADCRILILDDSTSAVDAKTASEIYESLDKLMHSRACTTFVVAQRISTIRNADRILLLDGGEIVAQGTHEELMLSSSLYGSILESQIK